MGMAYFIENIDRFFLQIKEAVRLLVKAVLWFAALCFLLLLLAFGITFYLHLYPYGRADFNQQEWLLDHNEKLGVRCGMALTIVEKVLKPSMTRHEVQTLLGAGYKRVDEEKTSYEYYYLGSCSPIAWDGYLLIVTYDQNDRLIEAYNIQG